MRELKDIGNIKKDDVFLYDKGGSIMIFIALEKYIRNTLTQNFLVVAPVEYPTFDIYESGITKNGLQTGAIGLARLVDNIDSQKKCLSELFRC